MADITHLLAGSGGGGGKNASVVYYHDRPPTLTIGANIWADGGRGGARWNEAVEVWPC